jgi:hypothetical protein
VMLPALHPRERLPELNRLHVLNDSERASRGGPVVRSRRLVVDCRDARIQAYAIARCFQDLTETACLVA